MFVISPVPDTPLILLTWLVALLLSRSKDMGGTHQNLDNYTTADIHCRDRPHECDGGIR